MSKRSSKTVESPGFFLLDSCVVEYFLKEELSPHVQLTLDHWVNKDINLAISAVTYSELIAGAKKEKVEIVKNTLNQYYCFEVSTRILTGAGVMQTLYNSRDPDRRDPGLADKIIAYTSILYNSPIITANVRDFPHPYFITVDSKNINYKRKNKDHYITLDILQPNYEIIKNEYELCN